MQASETIIDNPARARQLHKASQNQRKAGISKYNKFLDEDPVE